MKKSDPLVSGWKNSVVIKTLAVIKKLKPTKGTHIQVWGSSKFVQLLLKHDLVNDSNANLHRYIQKYRKATCSAANEVQFIFYTLAVAKLLYGLQIIFR